MSVENDKPETEEVEESQSSIWEDMRDSALLGHTQPEEPATAEEEEEPHEEK